jgi:hypothetical protein
VERALVEQALEPLLREVATERSRQVEIVSRHTRISLEELIRRQTVRQAELLNAQHGGDTNPLLAANLKQVEERLDELNLRLERRLAELEQERHAMISDLQYHGRAWVLPHPERTSPSLAGIVRDEETERIAVDAVKRYEEAQGRRVVSVERENRGFDLISRQPHPEDPETAIEVRFIEVKGRAVVGEVALTVNEYKMAERLGKDYWLYVVFDCATKPEVRVIQDPVRLGWEPLVKIEHYHLGVQKILDSSR